MQNQRGTQSLYNWNSHNHLPGLPNDRHQLLGDPGLRKGKGNQGQNRPMPPSPPTQATPWEVIRQEKERVTTTGNIPRTKTHHSTKKGKQWLT